MKRLSRRSLIGSIGAGTVVGLAGCSSGDSEGDPDDGDAPAGDGDTPTEEPPDSEGTPDDEGTPDEPPQDAELPPGLERAFGFLHLQASETPAVLTFGQPSSSGGLFPLSEGRIGTLTGDSDLDWVVQGYYLEPDRAPHLVATGSISLGDRDELTAVGTTQGFDQYEADSTDLEGDDVRLHLATNGEVLVAGSQEWVESALAAHAAGDAAYLEENEAVPELLGVVDVGRYNVRLFDGREVISDQLAVEVELSTVPELFAVGGNQTEEQIELAVAASYAEPVGETETAGFSRVATSTFDLENPDPETVADGRVLRIEDSMSYTPPEERPDAPGHLRYAGYDADAEVVTFEFRNGDPVPVENVEIEIDDEVYEGDWARGQAEVGEGSIVAIDADAIEPGDSLTVTYEGEGHSSSSGTRALAHLPFRVEYAPDERRGTVEYLEGPPLDTDRVAIEFEDDRTVEPWEGTITAGDTAAVEDVAVGTRFEVVYERSGGERVAIGYGKFRPPGRFGFEYDAPARELTVAYPDPDEPETAEGHRLHPAPDPEPIPADEYEIRVDGEPAATQLTDAGETFEPSESVTVTDVPVGVEVEVVWVGEDGTVYRMGATGTAPAVEFAFEFEDGSVVVTHAGGMAVDADALTLELFGPESRTVEWTGTDTVEEGDELVLEDVGERAVLVVQYNDQVIAEQRLAKLREDGTAGDGNSGNGSENSEADDGAGGSAGSVGVPVAGLRR